MDCSIRGENIVAVVVRIRGRGRVRVRVGVRVRVTEGAVVRGVLVLRESWCSRRPIYAALLQTLHVAWPHSIECGVCLGLY